MNAPGTTPTRPLRGRASGSARSPQAEPFCELCGEPIDAEEVSVEAFEITGFLTCTDCLESLAEQGPQQ